MKIPFTKKTMFFTLMALTLAQFACNFGRPQPSTTTPESPVTSSLATQPALSSNAGNCQNDYLPVKVGATWTSNGKISSESFTRVSTITSVGKDNFQSQTVLTDSLGKQISTIESWNCTTGGLVQLGGPLASPIQSTFGSDSMKTISTTGITLPAHINPGDSWSQQTQLEFTIPNLSITGTLNYNFQALGLEQVTVPAGTFNAMKVQVNAKSESVKSGLPIAITADGFYWFAPGVGRVKGSEKISANGSLVSDVEGELQSYSIP
jgi:hypothetical protein